MTRCYNHHNLDPAVYPYFEIYPKIQTAQSRARIKSYIRSVPGRDLGGQPWGFGWPSFRTASPPTSTSTSVISFTSSPALKSVMVYPVIEICEFFTTWDSVRLVC